MLEALINDSIYGPQHGYVLSFATLQSTFLTISTASTPWSVYPSDLLLTEPRLIVIFRNRLDPRLINNALLSAPILAGGWRHGREEMILGEMDVETLEAEIDGLLH